MATNRVSCAAGNPTNIIVGQAIDLSFINFSKWTLLPTLRAHLIPALLYHCPCHYSDASKRCPICRALRRPPDMHPYRAPSKLCYVSTIAPSQCRRSRLQTPSPR